MKSRNNFFYITVFTVLLSGLLSACSDDMKDQPRYEPLEKSTFFKDGRASQIPVEGTVARGYLKEDDHLYRGKSADGQWATDFPFLVDEKMIRRGKERYEIFCSMCHDYTGNGNGMIVQRGFPQPQSLHIERLKAAPEGYLFEILSNGLGNMPGYASQIPTQDRWAIIAYLRALQKSQNYQSGDLTAGEQSQLLQMEADKQYEQSTTH